MDCPEDERYAMIESPSYYEGYVHVLEAIKQIKVERFPMERYIVK